VTLEVGHLRDHLSEKDLLIHQQRIKMNELTKSNEQLTLQASKSQSEL
jgi:hypothetical protein